MLSSSCTSPYAQRVLIPVLLSHTENICQSETSQTLYSIFWIKSLLLFHTPLLKSPQTLIQRPQVISGGDLVVSRCARARMCERARVCYYKGRIWGASGKTNTDSDRCQQHLSDLHFLIANELPKNHFTSTNRQHNTDTSSSWRRKCFHRNIYRRLRKLSHKPKVARSLFQWTICSNANDVLYVQL